MVIKCEKWDEWRTVVLDPGADCSFILAIQLNLKPCRSYISSFEVLANNVVVASVALNLQNTEPVIN